MVGMNCKIPELRDTQSALTQLIARELLSVQIFVRKALLVEFGAVSRWLRRDEGSCKRANNTKLFQQHSKNWDDQTVETIVCFEMKSRA